MNKIKGSYHWNICLLACIIFSLIPGHDLGADAQTESIWLYFSQSDEFFPSGPPTPSLPTISVSDQWYVHQSGIFQYFKVSGNRLFVLNEYDCSNTKEIVKYLNNVIGTRSFGFRKRGDFATGEGVSVNYVPAYSLVVTHDSSAFRVIYGGLTLELPEPLNELQTLLKKKIADCEPPMTESSKDQAYLQVRPLIEPSPGLKEKVLSWLERRTNNSPSDRIYKNVDVSIGSPEIIKALQYPYRMVELKDIESAARALAGDTGHHRWIENPRWNIDLCFEGRHYRLTRYNFIY